MEDEKALTLDDLKCESCLQKENFTCCKHVNSPRSIEEIEKTLLIDEAIENVTAPGDEGKYMFQLEYPEIPRANLTEEYQIGLNGNLIIAKRSSLNLRKTLQKEGYIGEFHDQIWRYVEKGELWW